MTDGSVRDVPIPGGWTETSLELAGRTLSLLLPADADEFLEHLEEEGEPLHVADPYWARLWPTSLIMAELVARHQWRSANALEIGCGIGIVGHAALLSGLRVTFSDYLALPVQLACENARRNGLTNVDGQVIDWRCPPDQRYPVILASDVLYDPKLHEIVLNLIERMLEPGGTCWIGDPGRYHCERFVRLAEQRGHAVTLSDPNGSAKTDITVGEFCLIAVQG